MPQRQRRKALITRPKEGAETLATALADRDIGALIEPMMDIHYLVPPALDLAAVQAILCTSANGVRAFARASSERELRILAVGDTTAARARAEGFTAVESAGGDVADLIGLATARLRPQDGPLLHIAGNIVAGDLVGSLREQGFAIESGILYEARPVAALSSAAIHALRSGALGLALFFSPRTAAVFARLAGIARVGECCATMSALSISPAADAAVAGLPWRDRRVAERPNQAALLDVLDRVLAERADG
jgi:uroporphyrinogen-III synthase